MPILVTQLRPEEIEAVIEFAKSTGCTLESESVDTHVSLLAKDGGTIVAAVLGQCSKGRSCELNVCLGKAAVAEQAEEAQGAADSTGGLAGELINKALMKVHGAGIRRCRINHHGGEGVPSNWPSAPWTGQGDTEAA